MSRHDYTGLLYGRPSTLTGIARTLDIGGTFDDYNVSMSSDEADRLATASDWYAVGADLYRAIRRYARRVDIEIRHAEEAEP